MISKRRIIRSFLWILTGLLASLFILIFLAFFSDYRPPAEVEIFCSNQAKSIDKQRFELLLWNIGYAGLDRTMDFFYDGGQKVRPEQKQSLDNLQNIIEILQKYSDADFILLQEVDLDAKRSYHINQVDSLTKALPNYRPLFAKNYDVPFVPIPLSDPLGRVTSGLLTLSKHEPLQAVRHAFPGNYAFPKNLFMLDRCFLVSRYQLSKGRQLLVVNTHNSAYDDGQLKAQQMAHLRKFLLKSYQQGHYIVVGGDWNQIPPACLPMFKRPKDSPLRISKISDAYMPEGWQWLYDSQTPTNRQLDRPFDALQTPTAIIDFYLLSPNIEALELQTQDLQFAYSDHQPVSLTIQLAD